jgi:hypothetical protein
MKRALCLARARELSEKVESDRFALGRSEPPEAAVSAREANGIGQAFSPRSLRRQHLG